MNKEDLEKKVEVLTNSIITTLLLIGNKEAESKRTSITEFLTDLMEGNVDDKSGTKKLYHMSVDYQIPDSDWFNVAAYSRKQAITVVQEYTEQNNNAVEGTVVVTNIEMPDDQDIDDAHIDVDNM